MKYKHQIKFKHFVGLSTCTMRQSDHMNIFFTDNDYGFHLNKLKSQLTKNVVCQVQSCSGSGKRKFLWWNISDISCQIIMLTCQILISSSSGLYADLSLIHWLEHKSKKNVFLLNQCHALNQNEISDKSTYFLYFTVCTGYR